MMIHTTGWRAIKILRPKPRAVSSRGITCKESVRTLAALFAVASVFLLGAVGSIVADDDRNDDVLELKRLSLEDLVNVEVTIANKSPKKLSDVAAAVFVITAEDIERSGATTLPGVLRMVPGIQVGRVDNRNWAVGIRGFNGRFSNKLLVQIDGRSVYAPLFSGVYWDVQNPVLEDIERIEVVRGPGATLWGANAVNGIINVITKTSEETDGTVMVAGIGDTERGSARVRHGGTLGTDVTYRVFAKYHDRDTPLQMDPVLSSNNWEMGQAGFRVDWAPSEANRFVIQGDVYGSTIETTGTSYSIAPPYSSSVRGANTTAGGNTLFRWTRAYGDVSESQLQVYYDRATRDEINFQHMSAQTMDMDWQHQLRVGGRHRLVWGLRHRLTETSGTLTATRDRTDHFWSSFVQDEVSLFSDRMLFTLGTKLEHNDYTGFEFQPSARLLWKLDENSSVWSAISRAVRTPARLEHDALILQTVIAPFSAANPGSLPTRIGFAGDPRFQSEDALFYELGYRNMLSPSLSLDVAFFYSDYQHLRTLELVPPGVVFGPNEPPHLLLQSVAGNNLEGTTRGVEIANDWQAAGWWRLRTAYSFLDMDLTTMPGSTDTTSEQAEGQSPKHQLSLRSSVDLPAAISLDTWLRHIDELPTALPGVSVPGYTTMDLRIAWWATNNLELSLIGQDLFGAHAEFGSEIIGVDVAEVGPTVFARIKWQF